MIELWADGACEPNPGLGGWGFLIVTDGHTDLERFGGERLTTNNRMEMTAILKGLQACADGSKPVVYSDSQYCVKGCTIWRRGWQARGYAKKKTPLANADLWRLIHAESDRTGAQFEWVKGHSGIRLNEEADRLASLGRMSV